MPENEQVEASPFTPNAAWKRMAERATLVEALLGGTKTMRGQAERWLPKHPAEPETSWQNRVKGSFLFPGYDRGRGMLLGKVFAEPVALVDPDPELETWQLHVDATGRTLTELATDLFQDALDWGVSHVLVDHPRPDEQPRLDQSDAVRPYLNHVHANRLRSWQTTTVGGQLVLQRANVHEWRTMPDGEWGETTVHRVRVYYRAGAPGGLAEGAASYRTFLALHEDDDGGVDKWEEVADEQGTLELDGGRGLADIPLVSVFTERCGFLEGVPGMEGLAWKNLEHWQSASEQRAALRFERASIVCLFGVTEEEKKQKRAVGTGVLWSFSSKEAKAQRLEGAGAGLVQGWKDLELIETHMSILALMPFVERASGSDTATARILDQAQADTKAQSWAGSLEMGLTRAFGFMAVWRGKDPAAFGSSDVTTKTGLTLTDEARLKFLQWLRSSRDLSRESIWQAARELRFMPADFDADQELVRLASEEPDL